MTAKKNINPSAHPSKDPIKKIFFSQDLIPSCNFAATASSNIPWWAASSRFVRLSTERIEDGPGQFGMAFDCGTRVFFFCWCVLSKRARDVADVGVQSHRLPSPPLEITLLV